MGDDRTPDSGPTRTDTAVKAALNLVPIVGGSLAVLYEDVMARRRSRLNTFTESAFSTYPGSADDFVRRIAEDSRLAELFLESAEAATRTSVDEKATALGQILAEAATATSDDETDRAELLTIALLGLERPHVRALAALADYPSDAELYLEHGAGQHEQVNADERRKARFGTVAAISAPVMSALVRHGLVSQASGYGLYIEGVTDFGRELLAYLEGRAMSTAPEDPRG